jgi:hypothetical protein
MKMSPLSRANGCHHPVAIPTVDVAEVNPVHAGARAMSEKQYNDIRALLVAQIPAMAGILPQQWPAALPQPDREGTLAALRSATSSLNEGMIVFGYGDGSIIESLRQDPVGRSKLIHVLILAPEAQAFAHSLGVLDLQLAFKELHLGLHYIADAKDLHNIIAQIFGDHGQIARIAGTLIMDSHPLVPEAARLRDSLRQAMHKNLLERYDCLGNDVYDTFIGAKHALMHGESLVRQPRSGDYANRYAGKSALCIASGPSVSAHFDRIREIQHEHVVICADSILGGLLDHGIEPDFVCMVERPDTMHRLIDDHAPRCRTVMFALPVVHPSSVKPFGDRVAWWWNADDLYPWLDPKERLLNSGRSTGTMTAALAGLLGVKTAYLIGHDLAFRDGQSHGAGASPMALETQQTINRELSRTNPNYYRRVMDVAKNGGGTLETMGVWDIFRSDLEIIVASYAQAVSFVNVNIDAGVGAVVAGTHPGALPSATGTVLEKSHPTRMHKDGEWEAYRDRCRKLATDFQATKERFLEFNKTLSDWRPLQHDRGQVEAMGATVDLTKQVDPTNQAWFSYVFRAAVRNLMVRLHHNTFVRTMAERNWNQVQVMRMYTQSMPFLIDRLRPELDQALESFK